MSPRPIHVTAALLAVLLELAGDADPQALSVSIGQRAAGDLTPLEEPVAWDAEELSIGSLETLAPSTAVFTDFYFPKVGSSLESVFGVDLGVPAGQTGGRFLAHPEGIPEPTVRDDFHATLLVAVPPWQPGNVAAFDRDSTPRPLRVVAATSPDADREF